MVDRGQAFPAIRRGGEQLLVGVRVSPSATRTALRGLYGERLRVSVGAPPVGGRANRELVEALAGWLDVRPDDVRVQAGHGSRDKVIAITGIEESELRTRLAGLLFENGCETGV